MSLSCRVCLALALLLYASYEVAPACATEAAVPTDAALEAALAARARHVRKLRKPALLTLIDYDLPFTSPRLWVIDLKHGRTVVHRSRVSHAWSSGAIYAHEFSNVSGSGLSSLGSYVTAARTYEGRFGHSLRVDGLDLGVNDNARARAIVFHPAGSMTHSLGCFMLPTAVSRSVIDTIAGGSFVYVHRSLR